MEPAINIKTRTKSIVLYVKAWDTTTNPVTNIVTNKDVPGTNFVGIPIR